MQEGYVDVGELPTHIMTWGKWIEEGFLPEEKEVVICITGNPGLVGFYTKFLGTLYESLDKKIPIWVIGHVGHDDPPECSGKIVPDLYENERIFDLQGQVYHKRAFIEQYVPKDVKIHLIGHSIGAYMILELLKVPEIKRQIVKSYMLFPTIERMAASPNGRFFTKFFPWATKIALLFYTLFALLPNQIKIFVIYLYFMLLRIPKTFLGTADKYSRPHVVEKVLHLAVDEMNKVKDLDVEHIKANKDLLKFYYGASDGWTPVQYFYDLKEKIPDIDAELCQRGIAHAFVLRSGPEMGYIVADWILGILK
uniref:Lipid droplet-associated hydrolase n=1 Tax=Culicoides sonorensis TaxID=179676 RepID=A0A336LZP8_CULSO